MSKKTIRVQVLEDLQIFLIFKQNENNKKEVKLILPEVVKDKWEFSSEKKEYAFAGYITAIGNEFIRLGMSEEETTERFKKLVSRTVTAGFLKRKNG